VVASPECDVVVPLPPEPEVLVKVEDPLRVVVPVPLPPPDIVVLETPPV